MTVRQQADALTTVFMDRWFGATEAEYEFLSLTGHRFVAALPSLAKRNGRWGDRPVLDRLADVPAWQAPHVHRTLDALSGMGERAATDAVLEALVRALEDPECLVGSAAAEALAKMGERAASDAALQALLRAWEHPKWPVRLAAVGALAAAADAGARIPSPPAGASAAAGRRVRGPRHALSPGAGAPDDGPGGGCSPAR